VEVPVAVSEGTFVLYSRIEPPLQAGDYTFTATQQLSASRRDGALNAGDLPVNPLDTHVRVRSPQYQLPPDQVLSTFPPAGSEGSYGSRLPQIVIRRRTLPWERSVGAGHEDQPWLALVVIAEGEADLRLNQPIAQCVTGGVQLDAPADAEKGNYLAIRESAVNRIFPTQEEVNLLAHAREVDINDTELMMGDDDGFLAVVIANRLPLPARDPSGAEAPVKYLACLVNLCGQFESLLEAAPEPVASTTLPLFNVAYETFDLATLDQVTMGTTTHIQKQTLAAGGLLSAAAPGTATRIGRADVEVGVAPYEAKAGWTTTAAARGTSDVYAEMAQGFTSQYVSGYLAGQFVTLDPELRFPVLLHWSFTSVGETTFRSLMQGLDSGLLGTIGVTADATGRPPFEVVETGHVGLAHRTRRGDPVRSWYRGPLLPHPPVEGPEGRLPLAHAADQIRVVVPDGREDISLAAAFEIGRLLALSRPSMIASLLRWRQLGYQTANLQGSFAGVAELSGQLAALQLDITKNLGGHVAAALAGAVVASPEKFFGNPRPLVDAGRPVVESVNSNALLAAGLGLNAKVFAGAAGSVLSALQKAPVQLPPRAGLPGTVAGITAALAAGVDAPFTRAAVQSLAPQILAGEITLDQAGTLPIDVLTQIGGLVHGGVVPAFPGGVVPGFPGGVVPGPGAVVHVPGAVVHVPGGVVHVPGAVVPGPGVVIRGVDPLDRLMAAQAAKQEDDSQTDDSQTDDSQTDDGGRR
jgi:hypothetical protein